MLNRPSTRRYMLSSRSNLTVLIAVVALLMLGAALAEAAVKAGRYVGSTSEHSPVTLTVAARGKTITHFHVVLGYNGKCGSGGGPGLTAAPASIAIGAHGRFSANVTLSLTGIPTPIHAPGRVFGRVSGSTVAGTVEQFLHGQVNKCYVETFTARKK